MSGAEKGRVVCFGAFEVDLRSGELRRNGFTVRLQGQPFRILAMLLECPGELVTREEIRRQLWPSDTFVDFEHSLNVAIKRLRDALDESAERPVFIETLPRRGYRFLAPVLSDSTTQAARSLDSLAVLPLLNATGDPETEYLSDGISENIINLLSRVPNLRVIPRTSVFRYKGREAELQVVARELNVRTVLTGKLTQRGDRFVVQTELVDVVRNAQLWGGQFNRKIEDIFEVQEELARQISENLQLRLTPEDERRLAKRPTQSREAYQFLLKANYHINKWTLEGLQRGMAYARQAMEADPAYAEAYAAIAAVYGMLGLLGFVPPTEVFPKAKAAALKALAIDDSLADAHTVVAAVRLYYEWEWSGAEQACQRAIDLNPNVAWAHSLLSDWLSLMGRHEEAMAQAQLGVELDPLSAGLNCKLGQKLYWRADYEHCLEQLQKVLELDPNFVSAHWMLAHVYALKGMYQESLATCERVTAVHGGALSRALTSLILAIGGRTDEAKKMLSELKAYPKLDSVSLISLAETSSVLGEKTEAFEFLEVAYQERAGLLIFIDAFPNFKNIRSDVRYIDLLRRIGIPSLAEIVPTGQIKHATTN